MVGTQAKATKEYLEKAKNIILEAIRTNNFTYLQRRLEIALQLLPEQALVLVNELARYEAEYTYKKIVKAVPKEQKKDIRKLSDTQIEQVVNTTLLNTTIEGAKRSIRGAYSSFADIKIRQYTQIVSDAQIEQWDDEELEEKIEERTNGLFTTQNLALAGLSLLSTVGNIRNEIANENLMQVEWVLDLELNNCDYCTDMANDGPYDPADVEGEIPAHANCGCTLIPIFDAL